MTWTGASPWEAGAEVKRARPSAVSNTDELAPQAAAEPGPARRALPSIYVVACCLAALAMGFFPLVNFEADLFVPALGLLFLACALRTRRGMEPTEGWRKFAVFVDPWFIVGSFGALCTTPSVLESESYLVWIVASAVVLVSMQVTALARLGIEGWDLLVESGVAVAALTLVAWVFRWGASPQTAATNATFVALCLLLLALLVGIWLVTVDPDLRSPGFLLVVFAVVAACVHVALSFRATRGYTVRVEMRAWLGLLVLAAAGAGAAHRSARAIRSHAVRVAKLPASRRAVMTLASVLVGPVLSVGASAADWQIDVQFTALVSGIVSVAVCVHVFNLMRRWGALEHDVVHDSLTGLPNRKSFHTALDRALSSARSRKGNVAVMFLDLDRFKNVNDSLGHSAGNEILMETARRLRRTLRQDAMVARLAGDEFAVLLANTPGPAVSRDEATENPCRVRPALRHRPPRDLRDHFHRRGAFPA